MHSSLDIMHARYVLGLLPASDAQEFAWQALAFGYDGALLRAMASLHNATKWEADRLFLPAIREMGFEEYSQSEACRVLVDDAASRIVKGELDAIDGATQIRDYWAKSGFIEELMPMAGTFEILLCTGKRDDVIRTEIVQVVRAHQTPSA